jgi:hypothetical protein
MFWFWLSVAFTAAIWGFFFFARCVRKLSRSRVVIRRFTNTAYEEQKCPHCTVGAQYLHPETGWGPIPDSLKMVVAGQHHLGPRQANIRACNTCAGMGVVSTRKYKQLLANGEVADDHGLREVIW